MKGVKMKALPVQVIDVVNISMLRRENPDLPVITDDTKISMSQKNQQKSLISAIKKQMQELDSNLESLQSIVFP